MKMMWAIDPFSALPKAHAAAYSFMKALSGSTPDIAVVYVASPSEANLSAAFDKPAADRYTRYPMELVKKALKTAKITLQPKKVKVIPEMRLSQTAAVECLVRHAESEKAECIVLNTHSRKGLSRLVLGSFAESLIHKSSIPLLVLNPTAKSNSSIMKILYAEN